MNRRILLVFAFLSLLSFLLVIMYSMNSVNSYRNHIITGLLQEDRRGTPENLMKLYDNVETFVMFIGHQRTGHSLVGSLLDAHPDVIIAHEYNILGKMNSFRKAGLDRKSQKHLLFYILQQHAENTAMFGIHADKTLFGAGSAQNATFHYTYHVPGQWQGTYRNTIKVIGDKRGGSTSTALQKDEKMLDVEEIGATVEIPMKFIHITRNPFDNIATRLLRNSGARNIAPGKKIDKEGRLNFLIQKFFNQAAANEKIHQKYGDAVIDLPNKEFVLAPKKSLMQLCEFLGITCEEDYLEACAKILHGTPSITRDKVVWTEEQKKWVHNGIQNFSFLTGYSFDSH